MNVGCEETCRNHPIGEHAPHCPDSKINWIINTSVDDARHSIRNCTDKALLEQALEKEKAGRKRTSLIKTLEARIRKLNKRKA